MKHINRHHSGGSLLLPAKHQIDPAMQLGAHRIRFERLPMDQHKQAGGVRRPGRQRHMVDALARLALPELERFEILQHFGQREELGNQLFDVGGRVATGQAPGGVHRVERAIGQIEIVVLVAQEVVGEWRHTDEIV